MPSQTAVVEKARAKKPTLHIGSKVPTAAAAPAPAPIAAMPAQIAPSMPQTFPLRLLHRAPENVRHIRKDEDVEQLKASITARGLLQSLVGYERRHDDGTVRAIMIVGGGRRLQALEGLWEDGLVDGDWPVPVLIRDAEEAVIVSAMENLEQKGMSAVDEYRAFATLVDTGHHDAVSLARDFGFPEKHVRQRLRLAELAPEILDALAERKITIDAAYAYATTQDRQLQVEVFKVQDKKKWEPHRPNNVRFDVSNRGMRTKDPIFTFVTREIYERDGGGYEDDLFDEATDRQRDGQVLDKPFIARAAAERMIDFQAIRLIEALKRDPKLAPTIVGHVRPSNLRLLPYVSHDAKLAAPAGCVEVDTRYDEARVWKAIRAHGVDVHVVVGIGNDGELTHYASRLFVAKAEKALLEKQAQAQSAREQTPEERAEQARLAGIVKWSRRLAVPIAGTAIEDRTSWPTDQYQDRHTPVKGGWLVPVMVYVTDAEIEAQRDAAAARYDAETAAASARQARRTELEAMSPPPAVIEVDGRSAFHWSDESWHTGPEGNAAADASTLLAYRLYGLLNDARTIGASWPTIEAYQADRQDAGDEVAR